VPTSGLASPSAGPNFGVPMGVVMGLVVGHLEYVNAARADLEKEEHVDPAQRHGVNGKKKSSQAKIIVARALQNFRQVGPERRGAGPRPARRRMFHSVPMRPGTQGPSSVFARRVGLLRLPMSKIQRFNLHCAT